MRGRVLYSAKGRQGLTAESLLGESLHRVPQLDELQASRSVGSSLFRPMRGAQREVLTESELRDSMSSKN